MIKNKCGVLGIGAYGGNQGLFFYRAGYPTLFANSARQDLDSLKEVDEKYKYHIPGGEGCNKSRKKSKELFRKDIDNIVNEIKEKLPGIEYLMIVASAGGGTGAGGLASMKRVAMNEMDLKACLIVTVLPDTRTESVQAMINAYDTLGEIESLDEAGATYILDNSKNNNKMRINEMFFCYMDALLTSNCSSAFGNVDDAEIEQLISSRGVSIISKLGKDKSDTQNLLNTFHNNVYAPLEPDKVIKYIGLINSGTGKNIRIEDIYSEVGTPLDTYIGYESDYTLCVLAGCSLPYTKMEEIREIIESNKETIQRNITAQNTRRLSQSVDFFGDIQPEERPKEKKKSSRDLLF